MKATVKAVTSEAFASSYFHIAHLDCGHEISFRHPEEPHRGQKLDCPYKCNGVTYAPRDEEED
jgi:hypothetical protein